MKARFALSSSHKTWVILFSIIILLGLYLRLETIRITRIDKPFRADAGDYTAYAYNMLNHGIYSSNRKTVLDADAPVPAPDSIRSPGYSFFLTTLIADSLNTFQARVGYVQAVISTLTIIIITLLALSLLSKWLALIVALLAAISPHLIIMNTYILTETLYTFWLCTSLLSVVWASKNPLQISRWIVAGLLFSILALIRPTTLYFIIPLIILIWFYLKKEDRYKTVSLFVLAYFALILIWVARNYLAIGASSDSTLAMNTLHHGMYPGFMYNNNPLTYAYPYKFDPESSAITGSLQSFLSILINRFIEEPAKYLQWYLSKPLYFFQWKMVQGNDVFIYLTIVSTYYDEQSIFDLSLEFMKYLHSPLVILSILGMALCVSPSNITGRTIQLPVCAISILYFYFILTHIVGSPFPRYSIPLRPLTYLLALYFIQWLYIFLQQKKNQIQHS